MKDIIASRIRLVFSLDSVVVFRAIFALTVYTQR